MATQPLTSDRLEFDDESDAVEYYFAQGWTDGLPVVPPTAEKVRKFLECSDLAPSEILGTEPTKGMVITAEKVAINCVMAGCKPEYFPVVLAGNGVLRDSAADALTTLANCTGMPVLNTFMGKGAVPASHPGCLYTVGLQARDFISGALEEADVVLVVGYDMVEYPPRLWNRGRPKKIVNVDFVLAEVDAAFDPVIEIAADIGDTLSALCEQLSNHKLVQPERFAGYREVMQREFAEYADDLGFPVKPQRILADVRRAMGDDDILLSDVGAHKMWIGRLYQCEQPNTCLISNGFCSMGFALPGAIGAKLAMPERRVLAINGDGGFLMNVQELETAVRLKLAIVFMIWNDSEYGLIRWKQEASFGRHSHIGFTNPDFVKLAESFGAIGYRVERTEDLPGILEKALAADRPVVIDCPVDYAENMKLSRKLGEIPSAERSALLKRTPLFADVDGEYLDVLADCLEERSFPPGAVVCTEGEESQDVFLIVRGDAEVQADRDGECVNVGKVSQGDCVGEMAVLGDQPRSATIVAGPQGLETLVLSGTDLREILINQPTIGIQLLRLFSRRLAGGNQG
ncbi:MAG: cyclic nucleotide-binding domain-containing protein [Planctomycetes bacterium]|nr:cyclic nucleotide-binding domain-containing protein [Planctomycetota bacterium]